MDQHPRLPDDSDDPAVHLRYYAPLLNARTWRWPFLGPSYHMFADALCWADEAPLWSKLRRAENVLRFLWYYRTGLILGKPRDYEAYWALGKQLFPRWVGFHPSRCGPTRRYLVIYRAGNMATARCLANLEREFEDGP